MKTSAVQSSAPSTASWSAVRVPTAILQRNFVSGVTATDEVGHGETAALSSSPKAGSASQAGWFIDPREGRYEQEANDAAEFVTKGARGPRPRLSPISLTQTGPRPDDSGHAIEAAGQNPARQEDMEAVGRSVRESGQPLDAGTRRYMEERFGFGFGRVRIHDTSAGWAAAGRIGARAFTTGEHVVFGPGQYSLKTAVGRRLLAHELAHVVQQAAGGFSGYGASATPVQCEDAKLTSARSDDAGAGSPTSVTPDTAELSPTGVPAEGTVRRIVVSKKDMRMRLETLTSSIVYDLDFCTMELGTFEAKVNVDRKQRNVTLTSTRSGQEFQASYLIKPGQANPATLLSDQKRVRVDVEEHVGPGEAKTPEQKEKESSQSPVCLHRWPDQTLVEPDSFSGDLFEPYTIDQELWSQSIRVGPFDAAGLSVSAKGSLTGNLNYSYGPGRLTDICLTRLADEQSATAPVDSSLLDPSSHADVTTRTYGGRARFTLPARAGIDVRADGGIELAGAVFGFEVAAAEAKIFGGAQAIVAGSVDAMVDITAEMIESSATLEASPLLKGTKDVLSRFGQLPAIKLLPNAMRIRSLTPGRTRLLAELGLQGRAAMRFWGGAEMGLDLMQYSVWRKRWDFGTFDAGIGWSGGLKYDSESGVTWDFGRVGVLSQFDKPGTDTPPHPKKAQLDGKNVVDALLDAASAPESRPKGTEDDPLPFNWKKFTDDKVYPPVLDIPNAVSPKEVYRSAGPTDVQYLDRGQTRTEQIGVGPSTRWPYIGKKMQYTSQKVPRRESRRLSRLLTRLGFNHKPYQDSGGLAVDHIEELQFKGPDHFSNLWPYDASANSSAGSLHQQQIKNYEKQLQKSVHDHWFVIATMEDDGF